MSLNFFSTHAGPDGKRYDAVNYLRMWLAGKRHLPKDLTGVLRYLVPELKDDTATDYE
jgi:hypothetical protein